MKKLKAGEIPNYILDYVLEEMQQIRSGEIILIAQDCYLMSVEVTSRRRPVDWLEKNPALSQEVCENFKKQILSEFKKLAYGRLVIKIQKGKATQFERTVQHRFTGLDGEGI